VEVGDLWAPLQKKTGRLDMTRFIPEKPAKKPRGAKSAAVAEAD
jgi:hypothetical protein